MSSRVDSGYLLRRDLSLNALTVARDGQSIAMDFCSIDDETDLGSMTFRTIVSFAFHPDAEGLGEYVGEIEVEKLLKPKQVLARLRELGFPFRDMKGSTYCPRTSRSTGCISRVDRWSWTSFVAR